MSAGRLRAVRLEHAAKDLLLPLDALLLRDDEALLVRADLAQRRAQRRARVRRAALAVRDLVAQLAARYRVRCVC